MTTIAVFADPPRKGYVLRRLVDTSPVSETDATALYTAMFQDVLRAVDRSGGELLVNYRPEELIPEPFRSGADVADELRPIAREVLDDEPRMEVQVGSTPSARVGNTMSHLLSRESVQSAAYVPANAPLLTRAHVDSAAMKLRRSPVVLGPDPRGNLFYAGYTDAIDFADAFDRPAVLHHAERAADAGLTVDFLPMVPTVETGSDLAWLVVHVRALELAGLITPMKTTDWIVDSALEVIVDNGELALATT